MYSLAVLQEFPSKPSPQAHTLVSTQAPWTQGGLQVTKNIKYKIMC